MKDRSDLSNPTTKTATTKTRQTTSGAVFALVHDAVSIP
jgi:hypothetical protein